MPNQDYISGQNIWNILEEITESRHLFNTLCTLTGLSIFWQQILLQCKKEPLELNLAFFTHVQ